MSGKCQNFRVRLRTSNHEPKVLVRWNFCGNSQVQNSDQLSENQNSASNQALVTPCRSQWMTREVWDCAALLSQYPGCCHCGLPHFHGVHLPADKTGGKKFSKEFEEASSKLEEFVNGLDKQVKNGPSLTEALENAGIFYEAQYKEVKVVANVSVTSLDPPQVEQHLRAWKMPHLSIPKLKSLWGWCKGGFQREQSGGFG